MSSYIVELDVTSSIITKPPTLGSTADTNECASKPCQHGQCVNQDGGYKCTCSPGWTGQNCQQDINECMEKTCGHGDCVNNDGGYKCTCSPGWTGQKCLQVCGSMNAQTSMNALEAHANTDDT
ncbi:uncharacterized protein LOC144881612 [Branchiostoma floridae x Branchiostoma japonicum]